MPKRRLKRHSVTQPLDESYRLIPLTQGQNAIVDAADYVIVSARNWQARWNPFTKSFYAFTVSGLPRKDWHVISMAEFLTKIKGMDHRNHNTLDNRRGNLRKASKAQNAQNCKLRRDNSAGFKGVGFHKQMAKWRARIKINKQEVALGLFFKREDAARAYDEAAKKHFGEFAYLNFPTH